MQYRTKEQVRHAPNCYLVIGNSSHDPSEDAIAFKWPDKNGNMSRPAGEMDNLSFRQAIAFAVREGFITQKQGLQAVLEGMH